MAEIKSKLAQLLVERGKISQDRIKELNEEAEKLGASIEEVIEKRKVVSEEELAKIKGELFNLPYIDLYGLVVSHAILNLVPREMAENYRVIMFGQREENLQIALIDPANIKAREAADFIARKRKLKPEYYITTLSSLESVLAQYTGLTMEVEEAVTAAEEIELAGKSFEQIGAEEVAEAAPVTKLVASIMRYAVENKASDIHIEPFSDRVRIRYRIDGILRVRAMLPLYLLSAIISRIKVMSNLRLDETRKPQDGRIRILVAARPIDLRVATLPLLGHEKVVMRVLDPTQKISVLEDLGYWGKNMELIRENLFRPHGMILATGPTGCGKTTTLYAILRILNRTGVNIITLEDPIEYSIEGINQSQVRPEIGYTFASGIRSIVRQDPDIMMVGEIRDNETAELAVHAALTGHLVLTTLHTNDAFGAIPRLMDMKIEPFLISSCANLIVAQRLVRTICPYCKKEKEIPLKTEEHIRETLAPIKQQIDLKQFQRADGRLKFYQGAGCGRCNHEGYMGRTGITEVLVITEQMKKIIVSGCKIDEVKEEFNRQKAISLRQDGYIKALRGETPLEEIFRATEE